MSVQRKEQSFTNRNIVYVNHKCGKHPMIKVFDKQFVEIPCILTHINEDQFRVCFTELTLGKPPIRRRRSGTIVWFFEK